MKYKHYDSDSLQEDLRLLKNQDSSVQTPPDVEKRLKNMIRSERASGFSRWNLKAAVFLAIVLIAGLTWFFMLEQRQIQRAQNQNGNIPSTSEYLPLTYGMAPEESLQTVRVRLPRSALDEFGISVKTIRTEEVTADIVVGESGIPYAIRLVSQ